MASSATTLEYRAGDTLCKGVYFTPTSDKPLPVVLVCHAWDGCGQEVQDKAAKLEEHGYIAFAIDYHGGGKVYTDRAELVPVLSVYLNDRALLLARMRGALAAAQTIPGADLSRIGAMGYCFGGMAALDLVRSGDIRAAVTFHGSLQGNTLANPAILTADVLVLHGDDDPLVTPDHVAAFKKEMTEKGVDWQIHAYSHTVHAFTRPAANDPGLGTVYSQRADRRSWQAMLNFFAEVL